MVSFWSAPTILAVPGRRYAEFAELLQPIHDAHRSNATDEVIGQAKWNGLRLVWAHDPHAAAEQTSRRQQTIDELISRAQMRAGKLDEQDIGKTFKGRPLSDAGAKAWLYREVLEARLGSIIKADLQSVAFTFDIDERALQRARLNDGKLLLVTNVADLSPAQVIERDKSLADIERGFRVLKSDIETAPVFHCLPERIRAHALLCFLALVLHRVLHMQLKDAKSDHHPRPPHAPRGHAQVRGQELPPQGGRFAPRAQRRCRPLIPPSCLGEFDWPQVGEFEVAIRGSLQAKNLSSQEKPLDPAPLARA